MARSVDMGSPAQAVASPWMAFRRPLDTVQADRVDRCEDSGRRRERFGEPLITMIVTAGSSNAVASSSNSDEELADTSVGRWSRPELEAGLHSSRRSARAMSRVTTARSRGLESLHALNLS